MTELAAQLNLLASAAGVAALLGMGIVVVWLVWAAAKSMTR